ncbi:hypothetical protein B9Z55_005032 [Caenorhabditis nigoni]|uniref:Uncharacterized protein n=1 Tax=Caenorhabditis nigoni TaxID=1611254 RepID=A0A2G5UZF9_9PELO|nr:hypothetical protein B9Z55_005032 [Caenorhabditis nigoni]
MHSIIKIINFLAFFLNEKGKAMLFMYDFIRFLEKFDKKYIKQCFSNVSSSNLITFTAIFRFSTVFRQFQCVFSAMTDFSRLLLISTGFLIIAISLKSSDLALARKSVDFAKIDEQVQK